MESQVAISAPDQFQHTSLDLSRSQIRLFRFQIPEPLPPTSGAFTLSKIDLELHTFDLDSLPTYSALSYEWGEKIDSNVYIDGHPHPVRLNLRRFLAHAYFHLQNKWLWADQICIAQSSISERNHQVQLMSAIYSKTIATIVWLGSAPVDIGDFPDYNIIDKCTYWQRLWILQETLLAPEVHILCTDALQLLWRAGEGEPEDEQYRWTFDGHVRDFAILYDAKGRDGRLSLYQLLSLSLVLQCSDPRDTVYGVMGLVKQSQKLKVDYGLSKEMVFHAALQMLLRTDRWFWKPWFGPASPLAIKLAEDLGEAVMGKRPEPGLIERELTRFNRHRLHLRMEATVSSAIIWFKRTDWSRFNPKRIFIRETLVFSWPPSGPSSK